jgi:hypothetical protein
MDESEGPEIEEFSLQDIRQLHPEQIHWAYHRLIPEEC